MKLKLSRYLVYPVNSNGHVATECKARQECYSTSGEIAVSLARTFNPELQEYPGTLEAKPLSSSQEYIDVLLFAVVPVMVLDKFNQVKIIYAVIDADYSILCTNKFHSEALLFCKKLNGQVYKRNSHVVAPTMRYLPKADTKSLTYQIVDMKENKEMFSVPVSKGIGRRYPDELIKRVCELNKMAETQNILA